MAKAKAESNDRVALYDHLIATNPDIERKGDANPIHLAEWQYVHPAASIQAGHPAS